MAFCGYLLMLIEPLTKPNVKHKGIPERHILSRLRLDGLELLGGEVVGEEFGGGDLEEPAVEAQGAVGNARGDGGVGVEIFQREQDVLPGGGGDAGVAIGEMLVMAVHQFADGRGRGDPIAQMRYLC